MSYSNTSFTVKFFRPPQRTVSCHNGLLDTRTKHMVAEDRFTVDQKRQLDRERRKSSANLQSIAFEQKQLEKRLSSLHNLDQHFHTRHRSTSEVNLHHATASTTNSNQNLLSLPKNDGFQRRFSATSSDGTPSENGIFTNDFDSGDEDYSKPPTGKILIHTPPIVAIIPPEEDHSFVIE